MDVYTAIAEPSRRVLLEQLATGEQTAGDLVACLPGLSQPAVSRHLRVLREAGVVEVTADGARRIYRLRPEALDELDGWLARLRRHATDHLDALERHLDRRATPAPAPRSDP